MIPLNKPLKKIFTQSFYLNDKKVADNLCLYFLFGQNWFEVTISDGYSKIFKTPAPVLQKTSEIDDEFKYPIEEIKNLYLGCVLKNVYKCYYKNIEDECMGVSFEFYDNKRINIVEIDDNIQIHFGEYNFGPDITLRKISKLSKPPKI